MPLTLRRDPDGRCAQTALVRPTTAYIQSASLYMNFHFDSTPGGQWRSSRRGRNGGWRHVYRRDDFQSQGESLTSGFYRKTLATGE